MNFWNTKKYNIAPQASTFFPTQSDYVEHEIRKRIVSGKYRPGNRIPTYCALEKEFGVSRGVMQIAIGRLKDGGFISSHGRRGTFVKANTPNRTNIGILFSSSRGSKLWSAFDETFMRAAESLSAHIPNISPVFYENLAYGNTDIDSAERLFSDLAGERLAGIIATPECEWLLSSDKAGLDKITKVLLFKKFHGPGLYSISGDGDEIINKALCCLRNKHRSRIAVIRPEGAYSCIDKSHLENNGLSYEPDWMIAVGRGDFSALKSILRLLFGTNSKIRPDGLLVLDDFMGDFAVNFLPSIDIRVGADAEVVIHGNWPEYVTPAVSVPRVGFDVGKMLLKAAEIITGNVKDGSMAEGAHFSIPAEFRE